MTSGYKKYSVYKDSGVEWLGEIPMEWEALKIKFLFRDVSIKNKPNEELLSVTQNQGVVPRRWVENDNLDKTDINLVEQLGSDVPRILEYYGKECFYFSGSFLRMVFPSKQTEQVTVQVTDQVENLLSIMDKEYSTSELMKLLNLSYRGCFRTNILQKAIDLGLVELTIPDKPISSKQKYRVTKKGREIKQK